jgi:hypothetical protein
MAAKKAKKAASKKAPAKKAKPAAKKAAKSKPTAKAKDKGRDKEPTAAELAAFLGVTLHKPLDPNAIRHFRRGLPGYVEMLDDAADALEKEGASLGLGDVTPGALRGAHALLKHLHAVEDVAQSVYRSIYEDRLQVDDHAMGMLQKITRRVGALSEDHPEILGRWKFLRDFLAHFHGGGRPAGASKAADTSSGD